MISIRQAKDTDTEAIWNIFKAVIQTEDTYVFKADTTKDEFKKHWMADYMHTYVAVQEGDVVGTYILKQNQIGLGSHVANGSYMVSLEHQGKGIGNQLCIHSHSQAKELGFRAIQFNIVVSTNIGAIATWKKHGFQTIGTTPNAFQHKTKGFVDALIMYRDV